MALVPFKSKIFLITPRKVGVLCTDHKGDKLMSVAENIELSRRWFQEVWNEGKTETVRSLFASDGIARGQSGHESELRGPEEFVAFVKAIRGAFPNIHVKVEDVFGADDKVVLRWSGTMTHTGDGLGMPATGKSVTTGGITIARFRNGQIVEGWDNWDQLGMLEQIGAYKKPQAAEMLKSA